MGSKRGFTLVELLAVLAIMSILAVAASPTFVRLMRDRRVNRAAMHLVDSYRTAKTRAMGRGQPMLVVWDPASGLDNTEPGAKGLIRLVEPVVTSAASATTCATTPWGTPASVKEIGRIDFKNYAYTYTIAQAFDDTTPGSGVTYMEVCFAPSGRSYIRFTSNGTFREMQGPARFEVTNDWTKVTRKVFLPPNGVARMQL